MTGVHRPGARQATLEDVAARAGVSRATASRVLNGHPRVSAPTRQAVEAAVAELGYAPNRAARSLAARRNETVALVVSEPTAQVFADPFIAGTIRGAAAGLSETPYQLVLLMTQGETDRARAERFLLRGNADGVLLLSAHADDPLTARLTEAGIPCVLAGRPPGAALAPPAPSGGRPVAAMPPAAEPHDQGPVTGPGSPTDERRGPRPAVGPRPTTAEPPGPRHAVDPRPPAAEALALRHAVDPQRPSDEAAGALAPGHAAALPPPTAVHSADPAGSPRPAGYVDADNVGGAREAVAYLLGRGRTTVATVAGPPDMTPGVDRRTGWEQALRAAGYAPDPTLVADGDFTRASGAAAAAALLARRPDLDAVFAASDLMALGVLDTLRRQGRRVPDDVAVVGFDDTELARSSEPRLTTVRQPIEQLGRHMAEDLVAQLDRGAAPRGLVLPTELVIRDSA